MIDTISSNTTVPEPADGRQQAKLKKACADFESLFLNYMLKSMRSSVPQGGITEQSEEGKMFQAMFDENLAGEMASNGGLGLGEILLRQLSDKLS